ncbi:MAG: hypothetical protein AAFQ89_23495 [Cyanobacteria bacterium J06626_18]
MSKPFKIFLLVALLALTGFLAWKFLLNASGPTTALQTQPEVEETPSSDSPDNSPEDNPTPQPFTEAVRTATSAAELTQTAQTTEEWSTVGVQWDNAMQLMMKVPEDHEQYAIAQDRIPTYQANRDYAFTNAGLLEP